jgi:hypothetical protein
MLLLLLLLLLVLVLSLVLSLLLLKALLPNQSDSLQKTFEPHLVRIFLGAQR